MISGLRSCRRGGGGGVVHWASKVAFFGKQVDVLWDSDRRIFPPGNERKDNGLDIFN